MSENKKLNQNIPIISTLRIYPYLDDFINFISENPVVILDAPTGSGKTLGVASAVASIGNKIMIAVPTRVLAKGNLESSKKISPNLKFGSAFEGKVDYDYRSEAIFATYGHVKNKMIKNIRDGRCDNMNFVDVLMIDEAHHPSVDNLLMKMLWKYCYEQGVKMPRLILSSATIDPDEFPGAKLFKITFPTNPVMILWHDKNYKVDDVKLIIDTTEIVLQFVKSSSIKGNILVFVPGENEMKQVKLLLEKSLGQNSDVTILTLCGRSTPKEREKVLKNENEKRKIIICTNVVEAGVTLPELELVVDMMLERVPEVNELGGMRLNLRNETKFSAIQRKGRVGRVKPGYCYRMCTEDFYDRLEEKKPGDILTTPIEAVLIEVYGLGLDPFELFKDLNIPNLKASRKMLENLGMLRLTEERGYYPTDLGFFSFEMRLGVRSSAFLWQWWKSDLPMVPGIIITALMDSYGPSPYLEGPVRKPEYTPAQYNVKKRIHTKRYHTKFIGRTDLHTYYNMWLDLVKEKGLDPSDLDIETWSIKNSINTSKTKEVRDSINRITNNLVRKFKFEEKDLRTLPKRKVIETDVIMIPALNILSKVFFDHLSKLDKKFLKENKVLRYIMPTTGEILIIDKNITSNLLYIVVPDIIVPLVISVKEKKFSNKLINVSNFTVDVPKDLLITTSQTGTFPETPQVRVNTFTRLPGDLDIFTHTQNLTDDNYNDIPYIIDQGKQLQNIEKERKDEIIVSTPTPNFVRIPKERIVAIYEPTFFEMTLGEKWGKIKNLFSE